ncbi:hypothetical protein BD410DRAFT_854693 [Rickenella mellea]|uniref:Uncharacterized protein n=1 Tax=Rickenella mellea TaxID=50990 RepID=A0A4Y7PK77_9AGAM|nr:hypothetical protein BD410DRAFT_854693 [Rickenella mellea]
MVGWQVGLDKKAKKTARQSPGYKFLLGEIIVKVYLSCTARNTIPKPIIFMEEAQLETALATGAAIIPSDATASVPTGLMNTASSSTGTDDAAPPALALAFKLTPAAPCEVRVTGNGGKGSGYRRGIHGEPGSWDYVSVCDSGVRASLPKKITYETEVKGLHPQNGLERVTPLRKLRKISHSIRSTTSVDIPASSPWLAVTPRPLLQALGILERSPRIREATPTLGETKQGDSNSPLTAGAPCELQKQSGWGDYVKSVTPRNVARSFRYQEHNEARQERNQILSRAMTRLSGLYLQWSSWQIRED